MDITFMLPICILFFFMGINIFLKNYRFYKELAQVKKAFLSLCLSIILTISIYKTLNYLWFKFQSNLLFISLS